MPREEEVAPARRILQQHQISEPPHQFCLAPMYPRSGSVEDPDLLARLESERPAWVILNVAGGIQEKLGHYLRQNLSYRPAIICTGAAIAFLSGQQANIPDRADKLYLGWLLRILREPRKYTGRYTAAFRLAKVMRQNPPHP